MHLRAGPVSEESVEKEAMNFITRALYRGGPKQVYGCEQAKQSARSYYNKHSPPVLFRTSSCKPTFAHPLVPDF